MIPAVDFETLRFRPGCMAPAPVVMGTESAVFLDDWEAEFRRLAKSRIVGHGFDYDAAVITAWGLPETVDALWDAYERLDVLDTMIFERIAEIQGLTSRGSLALDFVGSKYGIKVDGKGGDERTSFGQFIGADALPPAHHKYVQADGVNTSALLERQIKRHPSVNLDDVALFTRRHFWLRLQCNYGMRTDPEQMGLLEVETEAALDKLRELALEEGFLRREGDRYVETKKVVQAAISKAYGGRPPMTKAAKGRTSKKPFVPQVQTGKDVKAESGDWALEQFARYGEWSYVKNKDLKMLKLGATQPIHTRYSIANTLRPQSSKPNLANISAEHGTERKTSIRSCFVPRPGYCFLGADHGGLESATLAQVCVTALGRWHMAGLINDEIDLHSVVGAEIVGCSYEHFLEQVAAGNKTFKEIRNCAKIVNFGRPGGMGAPTLKMQARKIYGIDRDLAFWSAVIKKWERANPDGMAYLKWVNKLPKGPDGLYRVPIPGTGIIRAGATFCAAANTSFQSLGAVLENACGWALAKACYRERANGLYGCKPVNHIYDEFILECPIGQQTRGAVAFKKIMVEEPKQYLPDVRLDSDVVAMARWDKDAKAIWKNGELEIYEN